MNRVDGSAFRGLVWAALSFALFVGAAFASLPVAVFMRWLIGLPHLPGVVLWPVVWGGLGALGVVIAARFAFGFWPRLSRAGVALGATGIGLSAAVHVVLQRWADVRFGYFEPDFIGLTAGLFAVLVGLAVAAFGVFVAPRHATVWPVIATLAGAVMTLGIIAANLPGLRDGIEPQSSSLAIWIGLSGLYALVATGLALGRLAGWRGVPKP